MLSNDCRPRNTGTACVVAVIGVYPANEPSTFC
ncbi:hypothetical protein CUAC110522_11995 [Cutibacterium acnes subsp. acnes]